MIQVYLGTICVYEGKWIEVSRGGSKTIFLPEQGNFVVLIPNIHRICQEEETVSKYLMDNNLAPALPVESCTVKMVNGKTLSALYAPSFQTYTEVGEYVIDSKNLFACTWESKMCMNPTFYNVESWLPVFDPLVQDLKRVLGGGIEPCGDSLNFLVTSPGSPHHVNPMIRFQVRYFGYDFSRKEFVNTKVAAIQRLQPGELLEPVSTKYFAEAVEQAVQTVLNRAHSKADTPDQDISLFYRLCSDVTQRLLLERQY